MQKCTLLLTALACVLAACGHSNSVEPGMYRAAIQLAGGEVPIQLRIDRNDSGLQLWVVEGVLQAQATDVKITGNHLSATLPYDMGVLQSQFDRDSLKGELTRSLAGTAQSFPITARHNESYRFWKDFATDNTDVSGNWRVQIESTSVLLSLSQLRDAVDGQVQLQEVPCDVVGQAHNDDVYLAAYCKSRLWLFKGSVTKSGELQGKVWSNQDAARSWQAHHTDEPLLPSDDPSRQVALPWAVPTR